MAAVADKRGRDKVYIQQGASCDIVRVSGDIDERAGDVA